MDGEETAAQPAVQSKAIGKLGQTDRGQDDGFLRDALGGASLIRPVV
jgi:hypothetical protein